MAQTTQNQTGAAQSGADENLRQQGAETPSTSQQDMKRPPTLQAGSMPQAGIAPQDSNGQRSQNGSSNDKALARNGDRSLVHRDVYGGHPFARLQRMADEMDDLFDQFGFGGFGRGFGNFGSVLPRPGAVSLELPQSPWSPQIETFERGNELVVRTDLPGLNKDDVRLHVEDDVLTIQGERRQERNDNRQGYYRSERSYGRFLRRIALPEGVDADQVKASFQNGVLEVTLPKPAPRASRARAIDIP